MRTCIILDDKLVEEALILSGCKTKKDLIHEALYEYVATHKIRNLMDIKGKIEFSKS